MKKKKSKKASLVLGKRLTTRVVKPTPGLPGSISNKLLMKTEWCFLNVFKGSAYKYREKPKLTVLAKTTFEKHACITIKFTIVSA